MAFDRTLVKDLRESAVKLIHRSALLIDQNVDEDRFSNDDYNTILDSALSWCHISRSITIKFLNHSYKKVKDNFRRSWFLTEWLDDVENKLQKEEINRYERPNIMMEPFNSESIPTETKYERLTFFVNQAYNHKPEIRDFLLNCISENEGGVFDFLTDPKEKKIVFRLKNISHIADSENESSKSQERLRTDITKLLKQDGFEAKIQTVSRLVLMMHICTYVSENSGKEDLANLDKNDFINALAENERLFISSVADTYNVSRTRTILKRIHAMKWGPKEFIRDQKVIDDAVARLEENGILTLTGVGAVGKTALANKLLLDAAERSHYDRFVTESTKVNSNQGELDPDNKGYISKTTEVNSLFNTLLNPDNNQISGSMIRLCTKIIQSVEPDFSGKGWETASLMDTAIKHMKENSILICIDNFEDIESPRDRDISGETLSQINNEYANFQKFFEMWSVAYSELKRKNTLRPTRIIITTRGKGEKTQSKTFPVPPLTKEENYQLFVRKLQSRVGDNLVSAVLLDSVQRKRDMILLEFENWQLPPAENKSVAYDLNKHKYQPAYTIFAASGIKDEFGENGIIEQIQKWNPDGESSEKIRKYVTSKIFGGIEEDEKFVFAQLLARGISKPFQPNDLIEIIHDSTIVTAVWPFERANTFVREYASHRDFFQENRPGLYTWNRFYFREIKSHFYESFPNLIPEEPIQDDSNEDLPVSEKIEILKNDERKNLYEWCNSSQMEGKIPGSEKYFRDIMIGLCKEKNLTPKNAATALIMLIGNRTLKAKPEAIARQFTTKPPRNNIVDKFINAEKQSSDKSGKYVASGMESVVKRSTTGKFVDTNFKFVWKYFNVIHQEINDILWKNEALNLTLRLYNSIRFNVEEMYDKDLIDKPDVLDFYCHVLDVFTSFKDVETATWEGDLFELVAFEVLRRYLHHLDVLPTDIREDLSVNRYDKERNDSKHYLKILKFVNEDLRYSHKLDSTFGKIFWVALRYLASIDSSTAIYERENNEMVDGLIREWYTQGARVVPNLFNIDSARRKAELVLRNFKQVVWSLDELGSDYHQRNGGMKGKLVYFEHSKQYSVQQNIIVVRGHPLSPNYLEHEEFKKLTNKVYPYRVVEVNTSNIYLSPLLDENDKVSDNPENLKEINSIKNEMTHEIVNWVKNNKTKVLRWPEFRNEIPHYKLFRELYSDEISEIKQYEFLKKVFLSETDLNLDTFIAKNGFLHLKGSKFSRKDKEKFQRYNWENNNYNLEKRILTKQNKNGKDGLSLPKDPEMFKKMFDTFYSNLKFGKTYGQMFDKIKRINLEEHVAKRFTINIAKFQDSDTKQVLRKKVNPNDFKNNDQSVWQSLIKSYIDTAYYVSKEDKRLKFKNLNQILQKYFDEARC